MSVRVIPPISLFFLKIAPGIFLPSLASLNPAVVVESSLPLACQFIGLTLLLTVTIDPQPQYTSCYGKADPMTHNLLEGLVTARPSLGWANFGANWVVLCCSLNHPVGVLVLGSLGHTLLQPMYPVTGLELPVRSYKEIFHWQLPMQCAFFND